MFFATIDPHLKIKEAIIISFAIKINEAKDLGHYHLQLDMRIIGGKYKGRALAAPKSDDVRPTTGQLRETLFNICQQEIIDAHFLDLFAGSGAIGLEALSRGASHVTFAENNRLAIAAIKKNIKTLQVEKVTTLYPYDVFKVLERLGEQRFDLIYIDPPYGQGLSERAVEWIDQHHMLKQGGILFIEDATFTQPQLRHLKLSHLRKVGRAHLFEYVL